MNDISPTLSPAAAFAWLEALPRSDVLEDIVPLRQCLRTLATSTVAPGQRLRALTLAEQRLTPISRDISALLGGGKPGETPEEKLRRFMARIDAALAALAAGSYGSCEGCGVALGWPALQQVPWAELCPSCAAKAP